MKAPSESHKRRIVEMFDSFCKTVSRNYSRNLKRAKQNHDKHFTQEPMELLLEIWGEWDEYPIIPYTFHVNGRPCVIESETLYEALLSLPDKQRTVLLLDFWQDLTNQEIATEMEVSVRTVYNLRKRAFLAIRRYYEHHGRDP